MSRATWIADRLRAQGLTVVEHPGWKRRGSRNFAPRGVVCHHTASTPRGNAPALNVVVNGRSDLPGPLAQIVLARDGTCIVVAAGRANHAGPGGHRGLRGNSSVFGIEAENDGRGERWTAAQLDAYPRIVAALLSGIGQGADACCGHREWAPSRKIDPAGIDMNWLRDAAASLLAGRPVARQERVLGRGDDGADVRGWQALLVEAGYAVTVDGDFGPKTEAATRRFQERAGLVTDGLVGPATRAAMRRLRTDRPRRPAPDRPAPDRPAPDRPGRPSPKLRTPEGKQPEPVRPPRPTRAPAARVLGRGDVGADVQAWQHLLVQLGEPVGVDGDFGPQSEAATRRLQQRLGVTADGLVGPVTRRVLQTLRLT